MTGFPDDIREAKEAVRHAQGLVREAQEILRTRLRAVAKTIFENDPQRFVDEGITDHRDIHVDPDEFECDDPLNPVGTCIYGPHREYCLYCGDPSERK